MLPADARERAVVVPVGAGREWFAAADRAVADRAEGERGDASRAADAGRRLRATRGAPEPALRVVFFGLFTPLQGAPTIGRAIDLLRDEPIEFTMIGHGQDLAEARELTRDSARVRWLDWVDSAELPDLVAAHDVSLGIFGTGPKAQRVVPTKVYQGLAAGCAVVTAQTPATGTLGDAVVSVPPGDPQALADALRHLALDKESLTVARDRARSAAEQFSPEASTADLDARLEAAPNRRPRPSAADLQRPPALGRDHPRARRSRCDRRAGDRAR